MKTLVISAIILAIFTAYFVFNAEKSISIKGGGSAVPAGIDVAKFILNNALNQLPDLKLKINDLLQSGLTEEIKSKIGEIKDKILDEAVDLIKKPIESKIRDTFCPQK